MDLTDGDPDLHPLAVALQQIGVTPSRIPQVLKKYSHDMIEFQVEHLKWLLSQGQEIQNPAAWLMDAIHSQYRAPAHFKTSAERERAAQEAAQRSAEEQKKKAIQEQREIALQQQEREQLEEIAGVTDTDRILWRQVMDHLSSRGQSSIVLTDPKVTCHFQDGVAVIVTPSEFFAKWIGSRLKENLLEAVRTVLEQPQAEVIVQIQTMNRVV